MPQNFSVCGILNFLLVDVPAPATKDAPAVIDDETNLENGVSTSFFAPWDPTFSGGRALHDALLQFCQSEIVINECQNKLPLDVCLRMKIAEKSFNTSQPCSGSNREARGA